MKSFSRKVLYLLGFSLLITMGSACNKKVGCPVNENVHAKMNKKGKVKGKAKSSLFTKKTTKRSKKKRKS